MKFLMDGGQMKEVDRYSIEEAGIPSIVLMERAALAVCKVVKEQFDRKKKILCVCGTGNNGADAAACARILLGEGYEVAVACVGERKKATQELSLQLQINQNLGIPNVTLDSLCAYDVIIDGLFGIGLTRELSGIFEEAVRQINESKAAVVSVDIPSGVHADNGKILNAAVHADHTVTFGYMKTGLVLYPGAEMAGQLTVADCGFAPKAIENVGRKKFYYEHCDIKKLPRRKQDSNKGTYGKILVIAGSENMCGAAYFSAKAAYRSGAGLVRVLTAESNREAMQKLLPEAVLSFYEEMSREELKQQLQWAEILIMGPGLSTREQASVLLYRVLEEVNKKEKPPKILLDADALNILAGDNRQDLLKNCVITPHPGEMSRLTGKSVKDIRENIIETAEEFARKYQCICVLKDARSVVSDGENTYVNVSGNSGMATAGSGDVLTGIIGGMFANGMDLFEGAVLGTYLHGCAGDEARKQLGEYSMKADDIADSIKNVINL